MSHRQIPGYEYDPRTDRYYRVQSTPRLSASQARQLRSIQQDRQEAALQRLANSATHQPVLSLQSLGVFASEPVGDFYLRGSPHSLSLAVSWGRVGRPSVPLPKILHPRLLPPRTHFYPSGRAGTLLQVGADPSHRLLEIGARAGQTYVVSVPPPLAAIATETQPIRFLTASPSIMSVLWVDGSGDEQDGEGTLILVRPASTGTAVLQTISLGDSRQPFGTPLAASVSSDGRALLVTDAESCLLYALDESDRTAVLRHHIPPGGESISGVLLKTTLADSPAEYFVATRASQVRLYSGARLVQSYVLPSGESAQKLWYDGQGAALYVQTHHHRLYMFDATHPTRATTVLSGGLFSDPDLRAAMERGADYEIDLQSGRLYMVAGCFVFVWALNAPSRLLAVWKHEQPLELAFLAPDCDAIPRLHLREAAAATAGAG